MEMTDYILLAIAAAALILFVVRLLLKNKSDTSEKQINKDNMVRKQSIDNNAKINIPENNYESRNMNMYRENVSLYRYQDDQRYQQMGLYDSEDEETVLMKTKQDNNFVDNDATVVINRKKTYIMLEAINNPGIAFRKAIDVELIIGRKPGCDIIIGNDKTISSRHCKIVKRGNEGFFIEDCNSANGTYINNRKLIGSQRISTGDIVEIGQMRYRLTIMVE